MKRLTLVFLILSNQVFAQFEKSLDFMIQNTSSKNYYGFIIKDINRKDFFIWSNLLIDEFIDRGYSLESAKKIIKTKILNKDTISVAAIQQYQFRGLDNNLTSKIAAIASNKKLEDALNIFFKKKCLNAEFSDWLNEIAFYLWRRNTFLTVGFNNRCYISIAIINNRFQKVEKDSFTPKKIKLRVDTVFYFPKYDFSTNLIDNNGEYFQYLDENARLSDVTRVPLHQYKGDLKFAKVFDDRKNKTITLQLFDAKKIQKLEEKYIYKLEFKPIIDSLDFNLLIKRVKRTRMAIIPELK